MEREVSMSVYLGTALIGAAALLGIIWFTVGLGKGIQINSGALMSDINTNITAGYIDDIAKGRVDSEMPAAAAYKIFQMYENIIIDTACGWNGELTNLQSEGSCMGDEITGKVQLELVKVDGGYVAFVHGEDCTHANGIDTDPDHTGFNQLKAKYGITTGW